MTVHEKRFSLANPSSIQRRGTAVRARLSQYYDDADVEEWMSAPHPRLGGRSANSAYSAYAIETLHRIVDDLEENGVLTRNDGHDNTGGL
ncbi:hypothetical protein [Ruegeria sp.]|uniref:hypothetical protein n=1 Tax=Ruegeria sp. TaxID=1879320 RepID=UPI003C7AC07D